MGDRKAIDRFEREMKAVGRLAHPNIVQAHDAREIDGTPVLVMEFVDGLDLAEIVRRVGRLPVAEACELVRQTAVALQCAHEHGLVHRDIKPSNIMLARTGEVKLLDLGLARFFAEELSPSSDEMTGTGQAMGTADYMAPEQAADSRTVDIRADLYSLGCTLYKLLSGQGPFSGPAYHGTLEKMHAHVHQPVPPIRQRVPDLPPELAAILDRMLAKNPGDRFATPAEVAQSLVPFCVGAELPALLQRAEASSEFPLPPRERQVEGLHGPAPLAVSRGWRSIAAMVGLALLFGGFCVALGIMIRIKKDRQETTVEVPEGSATRVGADGQVEVQLPGQAGPSPSAAVAADKAIQGTWQVISSRFLFALMPGGYGASGEELKRLEAESIKTTKVIITADRLKIVGPNVDPTAYTYEANPAASPKIIDLHGFAKNWLGIYRLDGDQLEICADLKGRDRPTRFRAESQSAKELLVLRRIGDAVVAEDERTIQGPWQVESVSPEPKGGELFDVTGDPLNAEAFRQYFPPGQQWTIARHQITLTGPRPSIGYALDPSTQPKMIGLAVPNWIPGIYRLQCDKLTFCIPFPAGTRPPVTFVAGPRSVIIVLKRVSGASAPPKVARRPPELPPLPFGVVIERVVNAASENEVGSGLDLTSGNLVELPKGFVRLSAQDREKWSTKNNVDLVVDFVKSQAITMGATAGELVSEGLKLAAVTGKCWTGATALDLQSALASGAPGGPSTDFPVAIVSERRGITYYTISCPLPATFAFETRKGGLGLLQVIRYTEEPLGLRLRYKLVQSPLAGSVPAAKGAAELPAVPDVSVSRPIIREISDYEDFTGRIQPDETAEVRSRVDGYLTKVHFRGGALVKKGDVLAEIDPRLLPPDLSAFEAQVNLGRSQLKGMIVLKEAKTLSADDRRRIDAQIVEAEARQKAAESQLNAWKRDVLTKLTAPISGKISPSLVDPGNLLVADKTVLATIVSVDRMRLVFDVGEHTMLRLRRLLQEKKAAAERETGLPVACGLTDETGFPHRGTVESVDNQFDPKTGTVTWRAVVPNRDGVFIPGLFVRVRLSVRGPHKAMLVPEQALGSDQGQKFVYLATDKNVVQYRQIKMGTLQDGLRVVEEGLTPEDWVITSQVSKLRPGMTVKPVPSPSPSSPPQTPPYSVVNNDMVQVTALDVREPMTWQWRVHLPKGCKYAWNVARGVIPADGFPEHPWACISSEPYWETGLDAILTVALRRQDDANWALTVTSRSFNTKEHFGSGSEPIPVKAIRPLLEAGGVEETVRGSRETEILNSDAPILLLMRRVHNTQLPRSHRTPGIMVWLQPIK